MEKSNNAIDIMTLSVEQLVEVKQAIEKEVRLLSNSFSQLKVVQNKYLDGKENLESINETAKDKEFLVPLTSSLYVPGKLADTRRVIVDIGTGYYVEQTVSKAMDFISRRVAVVEENLTKIQQAIESKRKNLEVVIQILQGKLLDQQKKK
eukprot:TRINITY_DN8426_c0_g1_i1.p1 TRINITY_DN8426_c0_g1~~TRINITY_DN8426_c0_g1_i1.p1  ORF type:complete len:163 (+),score=37.94 TRINITY_DN8426_c0_g1_i1:42-491(+)